LGELQRNLAGYLAGMDRHAPPTSA
jgi:hypothetical protein